MWGLNGFPYNVTLSSPTRHANNTHDYCCRLVQRARDDGNYRCKRHATRHDEAVRAIIMPIVKYMWTAEGYTTTLQRRVLVEIDHPNWVQRPTHSRKYTHVHTHTYTLTTPPTHYHQWCGAVGRHNVMTSMHVYTRRAYAPRTIYSPAMPR